MHFNEFLRDRRPYIAVYCGFGLLAIAIIQLDLWLSGSSLRIGNVLYIGLFGVIGLALWLILDFRRQQAFLKQFDDQTFDQSLDQMSILSRPLTIEQQLYSEAWSRLYAHLRSEVATEQERNRERIDLITQWAHHMKTPLAVIDLELQKAREAALTGPADTQPSARKGTPTGSAAPQLIESITEENERLRHSLHMLLNMIRLDDFAADFKIEQVSLLPLLRDVVNEHKRAFIIHRVYPKIEEPDASMPPRFLHVESDVKWLKFVLDQIVRNAITYSVRPERNGNVTFRFYRGNNETVLEVADDGSGIAPEDLGRVFKPFFTGTGGRDYSFSTGMGLYLAKETCRRLGHRLTVQSVPGQGTRVRIHFADDSSIFSGLTGRRAM